MSVARNVMWDPFLMPGGGATEMAVSVALAEKVLSFARLARKQGGGEAIEKKSINE